MWLLRWLNNIFLVIILLMLIDKSCFTVFLRPRKYLSHFHLTITGNVAGECPEGFIVVLTLITDYYPHFTCEETEAHRR